MRPPLPPIHTLCVQYHTGKLVVRDFGIKIWEMGVKSRDRTEKGKRETAQKRRHEDDNIDSKTVEYYKSRIYI